MKCLDCGTEMEHGSVEGIGQGGGHWYEFTSVSYTHLTLPTKRIV